MTHRFSSIRPSQPPRSRQLTTRSRWSGSLMHRLLIIVVMLWLVGCSSRNSAYMDMNRNGFGTGIIRTPDIQSGLGGTRGGTGTAPPQTGRFSGIGSLNTTSSDRLTLTPGDIDETWIIVRPDPEPPKPAALTPDDEPGTGAMVVVSDDQPDRALPLLHTRVTADVDAFLARVQVTQRFHNPYPERIEAMYVFPLPQDAAINEFIMTVGTRRIRGIIRPREQAERIYAQARATGHTAALITQERPNIFAQRLANIAPDQHIDVDIHYFNTLSYRDGQFEFVFPMVVGPRFHPAHTQHRQAVPRYLRPDQRRGHDVAVTLHLNAGLPIQSLTSPSHQLTITRPSPTQARVQLAPQDRIPNRDFVLRFNLSSQAPQGVLLTQSSRGGHYLTMMVVPPDTARDTPREPLDLVCLIDVSGSMGGRPLAQVKQALLHLIDQLDEGDRLQLIRYADQPQAMTDQPVTMTASAKAAARQWVRSLTAARGTHIERGLANALAGTAPPGRSRYLLLMTDGYLGQEAEVLKVIRAGLGESRIFSFGVGQAPNRYLLNRIAALGRGVEAYLRLDEAPGPVIDAFLDRVSQPLLTDLQLNLGQARTSDHHPDPLPDLFAGQPLILTARYDGPLPATARLTGRRGNESIHLELPIRPLAHRPGTRPPLPTLWARAQIAALAHQAIVEGDPDQTLSTRIRQLALDHDLLSAMTAFVSVDATAPITHTPGSLPRAVDVPVPLPDGMEREIE